MIKYRGKEVKPMTADDRKFLSGIPGKTKTSGTFVPEVFIFYVLYCLWLITVSLFHYSYTEYTVNRGKAVYNVLGGCAFHINHGISHFSFGLVGHIGNVDSVVA